MSASKTVLITGVSSGIGRATAILLASRGFRVFGTVRGQAPPGLPGIEIVRLDVTDQASVQSAVQSVLAKAGRLDALVNSAGYFLVGGIEETSVAEAQQQFDTNFFGVLRMTQAVLPAMRAQGSGRIVNVSSVLGFLPAPYTGIYAASKHAIEAYTETLDHEVRGFGVRALLVEPSFTKTELAGKGRAVAASIGAYAEQRARVTAAFRRKIESGSEPLAVAEAIFAALTAPSPKLRYPVGEGVMLRRLRRYIPDSLFEKSFRKQFEMDGPGRAAA